MDRALVERARDGDHHAFDALAGASSGRLYAVAALILRDDDRAKDAVQEALIRAWRGIRALREPGAWDAWLYRLVVRACYRLIRTDRRVPVVELHLADDAGPLVADDGPAIADRDQLERGFTRLPAGQRAILVLHYYLGPAWLSGSNPVVRSRSDPRFGDLGRVIRGRLRPWWLSASVEMAQYRQVGAIPRAGA